MLIGTILNIRAATEPTYTTLTLLGYELSKTFSHDSSFNTITTRFQQPIQPAGFVGTRNSEAGVLVPSSPNVTLEFVIDVLYPQGQELDPDTITTEGIRLQAVAAINSAFGLSLS